MVIQITHQKVKNRHYIMKRVGDFKHNYPKLMTTDQMMNHSRMFISYKDIRLELAINLDSLMKLKQTGYANMRIYYY